MVSIQSSAVLCVARNWVTYRPIICANLLRQAGGEREPIREAVILIRGQDAVPQQYGEDVVDVHVPSVGVDGAEHRQQVGDERNAERVSRGLEAPVLCTYVQLLPGNAPLCRPRSGSVHSGWCERGEVHPGLGCGCQATGSKPFCALCFSIVGLDIIEEAHHILLFDVCKSLIYRLNDVLSQVLAIFTCLMHSFCSAQEDFCLILGQSDHK